jgi:hypothetical protein
MHFLIEKSTPLSMLILFGKLCSFPRRGRLSSPIQCCDNLHVVPGNPGARSPGLRREPAHRWPVGPPPLPSSSSAPSKARLLPSRGRTGCWAGCTTRFRLRNSHSVPLIPKRSRCAQLSFYCFMYVTISQIDQVALYPPNPDGTVPAAARTGSSSTEATKAVAPGTANDTEWTSRPVFVVYLHLSDQGQMILARGQPGTTEFVPSLRSKIHDHLWRWHKHHILPQRLGHEKSSHTSGSNRIALVGVQWLSACSGSGGCWYRSSRDCSWSSVLSVSRQAIFAPASVADQFPVLNSDHSSYFLERA